jgi:hypothetical protein
MLRSAAAFRVALMTTVALAISSCGGDGTEADRAGVGAACSKAEDCPKEANQCLAFKGGYCGLEGCQKDQDCPSGSACVAHTDQKAYCFLICVEKIDCNRNRPAEIESNCSSNVTFVSGNKGIKACVPPSSS